MLLELLNHHEDLFIIIIEPLIGARRAADLAALAACCRQMSLFIGITPFYKHSKSLCCSLKNIKSMNIISNEYCSIKEYNNDLHVFRYSPPPAYDYRFHPYTDYYYIRTIKARIFYRIRCNEEIKISKNHDDTHINIYVKDHVPSWISKYPINITEGALQYYTFAVC